ncbi:phospholipase A2 inhibitor subunit gamma B-like [Thamnophis elegans]|uniref:phospholipase A2 inhibitor subunit gamma B-like n=1 Tax=Thamnophis elegans TaxID=35005 RepID=UPI0013783C9A|nr:phospholipase A2 inhibitor subunit gamma B-like [Thamnophis elegans]
MKISLITFLPLALFITKGLSLECEECFGLGGCFGNMVACDFGKDTCSVTNLVLPTGLSLTIKTCVSSEVCDKGIQVINLGQLGKAVGHLRCCKGDDCGVTVRPELPKKAPANGKQCPACFALGKTCFEEVTNCTGDELYCAEGLLDISLLEVSLKGCANRALCDSLVGYEAMAPVNSGHHAMQCTPGSSIYQQEVSTVGQWNDLTQGNSGGVNNSIPRWFGLIITILSGILLGKLLG